MEIKDLEKFTQFVSWGCHTYEEKRLAMDRLDQWYGRWYHFVYDEEFNAIRVFKKHDPNILIGSLRESDDPPLPMPKEFSRTRYNRERWARRGEERLHIAAQDQIKVWHIEDLYPTIETTLPNGDIEHTLSIFPHQRKVHDRRTPQGNRPKFVLVSGAYGSGKSTAVCVHVVHTMLKHPGFQWVCIAAFDYYYDETVWPNFTRILPFEDDRVLKMEYKMRRLTLKNGSQIRFRAYDDPEKIKGWECDGIWYFEADRIGEGNNAKARSIWNAAIARLRRPSSFKKEIILEQNPGGHNWTYKLFILPCKNKEGITTWEVEPGVDLAHPKGKKAYKEWEHTDSNGDTWYAIASRAGSNLALPGYEGSLFTQYMNDPQLVASRIEGEFDPITKLAYDLPVYDANSPKNAQGHRIGTHHVELIEVLRCHELDHADEFGLSKYWPVVCGIDVGGPQSPWAFEYYIQTPFGDWIGFAEIYRVGLQWKDAAEMAKQVVEGYTNVSWFIDPKSGPKHEGPSQVSVIETFAEYDLFVEIARAYNVNAGVRHVSRFLLPDRTEPNPYRPDEEWLEEEEQYKYGACQLYYINGAMTMNCAEKEVWRWEPPKTREPKDTEEGLSPHVKEKLVDRDDHAQTAEIFAFAGISPIQHRHTRGGMNQDHREDPYGARRRGT